MSTVNDISELILTAVLLPLDREEDVSISMSQTVTGVLYQVAVAESDLSNVIGKGGCTIRAIRSVLSVLGKSAGCKLKIDVTTAEELARENETDLSGRFATQPA